MSPSGPLQQPRRRRPIALRAPAVESTAPGGRGERMARAGIRAVPWRSTTLPGNARRRARAWSPICRSPLTNTERTGTTAIIWSPVAVAPFATADATWGRAPAAASRSVVLRSTAASIRARPTSRAEVEPNAPYPSHSICRPRSAGGPVVWRSERAKNRARRNDGGGSDTRAVHDCGRRNHGCWCHRAGGHDRERCRLWYRRHDR